jgi:hypothetical protein
MVGATNHVLPIAQQLFMVRARTFGGRTARGWT